MKQREENIVMLFQCLNAKYDTHANLQSLVCSEADLAFQKNFFLGI